MTGGRIWHGINDLKRTIAIALQVSQDTAGPSLLLRHEANVARDLPISLIHIEVVERMSLTALRERAGDLVLERRQRIGDAAAGASAAVDVLAGPTSKTYPAIADYNVIDGVTDAPS